MAEAAFVPPPPPEMHQALYALETYLHSASDLPLLVKVALIHAQFETIHPFLDGNGRVGRLLITFLLCHAQVLRRPLLYLSYFFKQRRAEYYARLDAIRFQGEWEPWVHFFLQGVAEISQQAVISATQILDLRERHLRLIHDRFPRASTKIFQLFDFCFIRPYFSVARVAEALQVTPPTAGNLIGKLEVLDILQEITGQDWGRVFTYQAYINILREGTDLPPGT